MYKVTNKLLGVISGQVCGTILAVVGAITHTAELTASGITLVSSLTMYLIGNGRSASQGEVSAPAIMPKPRSED